MGRIRRSKNEWAAAIGRFQKPRRLKLLRDVVDNVYKCPIGTCDHVGFTSVRGCRKHVCNHHGWYYFFDEKPRIEHAFPQDATQQSRYVLPRRCDTQEMPCFNRGLPFAASFQKWLQSEVGGGKSAAQSSQVSVRLLKYLKFCCQDVEETIEPTLQTIDYCLGCIQLLGDFINELSEKWSVGYSGKIAYLDAVSHALDNRRLNGARPRAISSFTVSEIFISRVRKYIAKKMRIQWHTVLSIEHFEEMGCWASLQEMATVIPHHRPRYKDLVMRCKSESEITSSDLSFATEFIVGLLFINVKASRPMTYQHLTVEMVRRISPDGFIDQTVFKTNETYGFDSLHFDTDVLRDLKGYIEHVRPRLNPTCPYVLTTRTGKMHPQICYPFSRLVYTAIGKYIHPTRYRQMIETESGQNLSVEDQRIVSADQKHSSHVASVHYKKLRSREVSVKSKSLLSKLASKVDNERKDGEEVPNIDISNGESDDTEIENNNDVVGITSTCTNNIVANAPECSTEPSIVHTSNRRISKSAFTHQEDMCLKNGLKRYGKGQWTHILRDTEYSFSPTRRASSLMVRAKTLKLLK